MPSGKKFWISNRIDEVIGISLICVFHILLSILKYNRFPKIKLFITSYKQFVYPNIFIKALFFKIGFIFHSLPLAAMTSYSSFVRGTTERRLCLMMAIFFKRLSFFISSKGTGFLRVSTDCRSTTTQRWSFVVGS